MDDAKQEIDNSGTMQGTVQGDHNINTFNILSKDTSLPIVFLAPPRPREFVGRDKLLNELKQHLFTGKTLALFAFDGLPGVGKTTLAIVLAYDPEVLKHFNNGVLWAGLGPKPDILARLGEWGIALGIPQAEMEKLTSIKTRQRAIREAIGLRRMLLVADDAWQDKSALEFDLRGPNCAFVVTTRQNNVASIVAGEGSINIRELDENDGLLLLKRLVPDVVKAEPKEALKLVKEVGGLPLALTLIGKYLHKEARSGQKRRLRKALSQMHQAKVRLELELSQSELDRHPSLQDDTPLSLKAVIRVSDDSLEEEAYQALRALSVFPPKPNTFSEDAALAVSNVSAEVIDSLIDSRLLESSGEDRYTMHQTIAEYSAEQLLDMTAYERLVEFFIKYIEDHETDYGALEREASNVLAALNAALDRRMQATLVKRANAFFPFLQPRGLYQLAEDFLKQAEEAERALDDSVGLTKTLLNLGELAERQGNYTQAELYLQEGLAFARQNSNFETVSAILRNLGNLARDQGEYAQAERYLQEGLILARQIEHPGIISALLITLGAIAKRRAEYVKAEEYLQEALKLARQINHRGRISGALATLGDLKALLKDYEQAEAYLQEGLYIARESDLVAIMCALLRNLGALAYYRGDYSLAEKYLWEGLDLARQIKHRARISSLLSTLGKVADLKGDYKQAKEYLQEALDLAREIGHRTNTCILLLNLGMVVLHCEDYESAKEYLQEALSLARRIGLRRTICTLLNIFGSLNRTFGDYKQAEKYLKESLDLAREIGHYSLISEALLENGELCLTQMNFESALANFQQALEATEDVNDQYLSGLAYFGLARARVGRGDYEQAHNLAQKSLIYFETLGYEKAFEILQWINTLRSTNQNQE